MAVCLCLHIWLLHKYTHKPSSDDQTKKTMYSWYMVIVALLRIVLLMPYRNSNRTYPKISNARWIILFALEFAGAGYFFTFSRVKGSNTFSSCLIDSICLISMFVIYRLNQAKTAVVNDNEAPLMASIKIIDVE